jgi:class 3 adenylate cyclase
VIFDETRIYGDGINIAARLEGIAEPWSPSKTAARWRRAFPAPGS